MNTDWCLPLVRKYSSNFVVVIPIHRILVVINTHSNNHVFGPTQPSFDLHPAFPIDQEDTPKHTGHFAA
jgi:hypothetical protein